MTKKILKILTLVFPVLAMGLMIASHMHNKETGTLWRVTVTGYDPRDLLRGHYLTYRYDWNWAQGKDKCPNGKCVLCLNSGENGSNQNPVVSYSSRRAAPKQCESYIKGQVYAGGGRFEIGSETGNGLRHYYIPEEYAWELDRLLRNGPEDSDDEDGHRFEIGLRVSSGGQAFIEGMYIDDVPLEEWIKQER